MVAPPRSSDEKPVVPDYAGANVSGLVPALLGGRAAPWLPHPVSGASAVVLLVLDGLGAAAVEEHPDALPTIAALPGTSITTVVPATTAAALTSITTGLVPAVHGITGFRVRVPSGVLNVLGWYVPDGHPPHPVELQRHPPFLGRRVPVVTKSEFRSSGFSEAHLRDTDFHGWRTTAGLVEHVLALVDSGEPFVYAYYPGVDTVAHEHGLRSGHYRRELAFADRLVGELLDELPADVALVVTSDHGQVHLEPEDWREIPELLPLVEVQAGDARFRHLYARDGARDALAEAARATCGDVAWVRTRREVLDEGWLGGPATGSVPGRVGDVVLAARAPVGFVDPALEFERQLRSAHGSLTAVELLVPLRSGRGARRPRGGRG